MKRFAIYDSIKNGDSFDHFINAETEKEAILAAEGEWCAMSGYDQGRRSEFFLAICDEDDDGCPDWNTAVVVRSFK